MNRDFSRFSKQVYDLLIIGGGINGAAIAHLAALRRMSVALVEKGDFASGTSSKSSKLMHGGLRYLEKGQWSLVREALCERQFHLKAAPHLVKPLPFIIPVYQEDRRPLWMMRLGVFLYDFLAGNRRAGQRRNLDAESVLKLAPGLRREGLRGGVLYYDAQMDDARVCLENVQAADAHGAHVANYAAVTGFVKENGRVVGARLQDLLDPSAPEIEIRARHLFCAAGPWTQELMKLDDPRAPKAVRPTKGVHLVVPRKISDYAFLIPARHNNRIFFILPWKENTMIGTTDTDFEGSPDDVKVDERDITYLLEETRRVFPGWRIDRKDVTVSFAGLRPLVDRPGETSSVSREHEIFQSMSGIHFVVGGKYTTYRVIAEDCLKRLCPNSLVKIDALFGSGVIPDQWESAAREFEMPVEDLKALSGFYGIRYREVLALIRENPALKEHPVPGLGILRAQLVYSVRHEMARSADDILFRRLCLGYSAFEMERHGPALREAIAAERLF